MKDPEIRDLLMAVNTKLDVVLDILRVHQDGENPVFVPPGQLGLLVTPNPPVASLEFSFLEMLVRIYLSEAIRKEAVGNVRKAPRGVSKLITEDTISFLQGIATDLSFVPDGPYIIAKRGESKLALLRVFTDIGYAARGGQFNSKVSKIVSHASHRHQIPADRVFILIASLENSMDRSDVEAVLGKSCPSMRDLLTVPYRKMLQKYLSAFISGLTALSIPQDQVFFLAAAEHPNVIADELFNNGQTAVSLNSNIQWLKPSITELVSTLNGL